MYTPKAIFAKALWNELLNKQLPTSQALVELEKEVKKQFAPHSSKHASFVPETERGRGSAGFGRKAAVITMSDLTDEERLAYKALPGAWKSEKEFLQAVVDDRKAARGER
jgi:hypothetical protein